ncbi:MAG: type II secretion system protein GspG [Kiritimatiellia bacterium]|nr:type II secretion system protein GspG [Kiritimatiellia bacterium]
MNKQQVRNLTRQARDGFTLIEILLVVVIIGMLATIVTVRVPKHLENARVSKARADIQSIGLAVQTYYMNEGRYPPSLSVLSEGDDPYLERGVPLSPWKGEYQYTYPGSHKPYRYDLQTTTPDGRIIANWNLDEREGSSTTP